MKTVKQRPLKKLDIPVAPAESDTNSEVKVISLALDGDAVNLYNDADAQTKAWEKEKEKHRPAVEQAALNRLYEFNCGSPDSCVKSVRVTDETGKTCLVSLADTYGKAQLDPKKLLPVLAAMGQADPNALVAEKVRISFDSKVFFDADGNLRKEFYVAVLGAMRDLAVEHGVTNPFSSEKVVSPVDGFAEKRWEVFTVEQQPAVSRLFPATVTLKPAADTPKKD